MPKTADIIIDSETADKVKSMSAPELSTFVYAIYIMGYSQGRADRAQEQIDKLAQTRQGLSITREA